MMKTNCIKFICGIALLGAVSQVSAEPVVYTMTSHLSGSLDGTEFTDAFVTLITSASADTTNTIDATGTGYGYFLSDSLTIQIDGLNLATFNGEIVDELPYPCGAWSVDCFPYVSLGMVGFVHPCSDEGFEYILAVAVPLAPIYDLSAPCTLTGTGDVTQSEEGQVLFSYDINHGPVASFSTDQGDLVITGTSGVTTFTAAAVPEPASAMMLIFGAGIGIAVHRARRSALRR
jgi:hypothetical protein